MGKKEEARKDARRAKIPQKVNRKHTQGVCVCLWQKGVLGCETCERISFLVLSKLAAYVCHTGGPPKAVNV